MATPLVVRAVAAPDLARVDQPGEVLFVYREDGSLASLLIGCPGCGGDVLLGVAAGDVVGDLGSGTLTLTPAFGHECGWRGHLNASRFISDRRG